MTGETKSLPVHVAIIMDGNGRWARKRFLPRLLGHRAGVRALERTVRAASELGISYLTVYAFSTENWNRPALEVQGLMALFRHSLRRKVEELVLQGVRLLFAGDRRALPADVLELMEWGEKLTANNTGLTLVACLNYGGRQELLHAAEGIVSEGKKGPLTEDDLRRHLYLPQVPDPDLIIRTSGEKRLSNFLIWQGSYSELYFTDTLWPDFDGKELEKALEHYALRERRYGSVK